jgi:hypothetical protein
MPCHVPRPPLGIPLSGLPLNFSSCLRASLKHKDHASTAHSIANARHWPERPRPKPCQSMPANAVSAHWPRQYVAHSSATVLPLHPYHGVEQLLPALYTLDKHPGLPLLRRRRPRRLSAARPVTDIASARAIPSPFSLRQCTLSIARTPPISSRPSLAPWSARSAAPWPLLHSTLGHLPPSINSDDRHLLSSHNPLPSPH